MLKSETCDQEHRALTYPILSILSYPILSYPPVILSYPMRMFHAMLCFELSYRFILPIISGYFDTVVIEVHAISPATCRKTTLKYNVRKSYGYHKNVKTKLWVYFGMTQLVGSSTVYSRTFHT